MSNKSKRKVRKPPSKQAVEQAMQREIIAQVIRTERFNSFFAHNSKVGFEIRHEARQVWPVVSERPSIELEAALREVWDELGLTEAQMSAGIAAVRNVAAWGQPPLQKEEEKSAGNTDEPEAESSEEAATPGTGDLSAVPESAAAVQV